MSTITWEEFEKVELRSGTIIKAEVFERTRKPAYKIWADFGPQIGVLQTSAQVTVHYTPDILVGRKIIGCVNLGEKNIAGFLSQFLLLGFNDGKDGVCLAIVDPLVPNGQKLH